MKELVILSGKGGTGKTSIASSFAVLAPNKVIVDCDVDAANMHLLLAPRQLAATDFAGRKKAVIDSTRCSRCGRCSAVCRFNAISDYHVDPHACEGCGTCLLVCRKEAIRLEDTVAGRWFASETAYGLLVHARLEPGAENSGKLVAEVREAARRLADKMGHSLILSDGPPGIGCPVISSLSGAAMALLVTEPSASALGDLERVLGLCRHFNIPARVCINKWDLSASVAAQVEQRCQELGAPVVGRVVFDPTVLASIEMGRPPVVEPRGPAAEQIRALWYRISDELGIVPT